MTTATLPASPAFAALKEDFAVLDDWEDRYRTIIELGRTLEPLDERKRNPANKVQGCASQVWIDAEASGPEPRLYFAGDSDALIVKGLIAILLMLFSGRTAREILEIDALGLLAELGLQDHLTPQRSNGLASMVKRIRADAAAALKAAPAPAG